MEVLKKSFFIKTGIWTALEWISSANLIWHPNHLQHKNQMSNSPVNGNPCMLMNIFALETHLVFVPLIALENINI